MSKILVAYFSASGVTEKAAKTIAKVAGADLFEIKPAQPYTNADLNWRDASSRSSIEMKNKQQRPKIVGDPINIADYDTILLGFPIWWYVAPTIINTFLESCDFSYKRIVLFATSGGSNFGNTVAELQVSAPTAIITKGILMNGSYSEESISEWLKSIGL